jgi:amino acid transporter
MHPQASAEFAYLRVAFPRLPSVALVTGLLVALSGAATAATVAIAFAAYFQAFLMLPSALVAVAVLLVAAAVNMVGVKESGWVNIAFTLLEMAGLVLFVILGFVSGKPGAALSEAPTWGVFPAAALVFFAFLGFENIANLAEEAKKPKRDLPRAILTSLGLATLLYVLVAIAAVALLEPSELAKTEAPLADAARAHSSTVAGLLGGIALFATANTALVSLLGASRVVFGIARERELPQSLAALLPRRDTPWAAIVAITGVALALVPFGKVGVVASMSSFAALLAFALVNLALIVLRYRDPDAERPFRVPGTVCGFPVLPALGVATTLIVATQLERNALVGGGVGVVLFTIYALVRHKRSQA